MSRTTIRDHTLFVFLAENQQLSLELGLLNVALRAAARSLWGTVESRVEHSLFVIWEISTYQNHHQVKRRLEQYLPSEIRWFLKSKNRVAHRNLSQDQVRLLLEFTGHAEARST